MILPVIFGWRTIFSHNPGKFRTIIYFACLGAGYIMVEVGLISEFILALSNATVSASILITGMLVFSGLGSFVSERFLDRARDVMPKVFVAIGAILIIYGLVLDRVLDFIGTFPYPARLLLCFALVFPPAFLMGFPMPTAMTTLGRLGKQHMFLWAWGINGCFSVIGAALVPIIATSFGLTAVLLVAGIAYLIAIPAFFAVLLPLKPAPVADPSQSTRANGGILRSSPRKRGPMAKTTGIKELGPRLRGRRTARHLAVRCHGAASSSSPPPRSRNSDARAKTAARAVRRLAVPLQRAGAGQEHHLPRRGQRRAARPHVAARRHLLGGPDLQRPARAALDPARLRYPRGRR